MAEDKLKVSEGAGCVLAILTGLTTLPMWYVLLYYILVEVEASSTMWALYWLYVPCGVLIHVVGTGIMKLIQLAEKQ